MAVQEVGAVTNQAKQAYLRESRRFREAADADAEGRTAAEAAAAEARAERSVSLAAILGSVAVSCLRYLHGWWVMHTWPHGA